MVRTAQLKLLTVAAPDVTGSKTPLPEGVLVLGTARNDRERAEFVPLALLRAHRADQDGDQCATCRLSRASAGQRDWSGSNRRSTTAVGQMKKTITQPQ